MSGLALGFDAKVPRPVRKGTLYLRNITNGRLPTDYLVAMRAREAGLGLVFFAVNPELLQA